jgi:hypothetical protein
VLTVARYILMLASEAAWYAALGLEVGVATASVVARLLDADWARLANAATPRRPRVPPSAPRPPRRA